MKQFIYDAEAGSIMLGTKTFKCHYNNGYGDGTFRIIVDENDEIDTKGWFFVDSVEGEFNAFWKICHL